MDEMYKHHQTYAVGNDILRSYEEISLDGE